MNTEYGKTLAKIRKEKGIKVKDICDVYLPESTYYRLMHANDMKLSDVLLITERLGITISEFLYIHNEQELDLFSRTINELPRLKKLGQIACKRLEFKTLYAKTKRNVYFKLEMICRILLNNQNDLALLDDLKKILSVEFYSFQEMTIFKLALHLLSVKQVKIYYTQMMKNIDFFQDLLYYKTDILFFIFELVTFFLDNAELEYAKRIFDKIDIEIISERYVGIKLYHKFLQLQFSMICHNKNIDDDVNQLIRFAKLLDLSELLQKMNSHFELYKKLYS